MYKGDKPNALAKLLNDISAKLHSLGIAPDYMVTLEVPGRKSGKMVSLPLVLLKENGRRYLVSMLGDHVQWILNVQANGNKATLHHGGREEIRLQEIPIADRAPLLKAYLKIAPGARPHIPADKDAPISAFEKIAAEIPVFEVFGA
ncbi:MAG: nitroreductase family deazaflavin-dependent oxidoreductase [Anaerolineae bacterium]|nr:nitroreductase family deazaflavin-dependent oxidoreductase [Anaerolineae bacterium]